MKNTEFVHTMEFEYKNWKGETNKRTVVPYKVWFGSTEFYKEEQWFLNAFDVEKGAERNFAMKDIIRFL